jgi:glutaredoxin 3
MQPVRIYTIRGCPFCVRAKSLLDSKRVSYREIDVSTDPRQRAGICAQTMHRTFPQIFIGESFIGGCDELFALQRAGKLDTALA